METIDLQTKTPRYEDILKQILELSIRGRFYVEDIYITLYYSMYPPTKAKLVAMGIPVTDCECEFVRHVEERGIKRRQIRVTTFNDKVVGFCIYINHVSHIEMTFLYVHPDYRERGIGTNLVNRLKADLVTTCKLVSFVRPMVKPFIEVKVDAAGTREIRFYERQGFEVNHHDYPYTWMVYVN